MARATAINAVASAIHTALKVSSVTTLAPGSIYRNEPPAQVPPYVSIGPSSEVPWDHLGTAAYGAEVTVPVRIVTSNADANGESRSVTILNAVLALLDTRTQITVTGWTVGDIVWTGTVITQEPQPDGTLWYVATATFAIQVRKA